MIVPNGKQRALVLFVSSVFTHLSVLRAILPYAFLIGVALATFWPILAGGRTLYPTDITSESFLPFAAGKSGTDIQVTSIVDYVLHYYPARWFQALAFRSGQINLWNPYVYGGHPAFASTGDITSLNPFNMLLLLPDLGMALAWRSFLQVVACMSFMYLYLRHLRLGTTASLVGSLGYSLNSMFWVNIFDWSLDGMLWLPLICLLLERAVDRRSLRGSLVAGLVLGVALLSSSLQIYFYLCVTIVAIFGLRWLILHHDWQSLRVYLVLGLVTLAIGITLSSVQLLPTLELLQQSPRMEGGAFGASARSLRTPIQMVLATVGLSSFVFPNLAGRIKDSMMISGALWGGETHWQGFIGIVPFILATVGALASRDRRRIPYIVLAVLVIITVLYTPLVLIVYERFFLVYIFCASVLAAIGCHAACENQLDMRRAHRAFWLIAKIFGLIAMGLVLFNVAFAMFGAKITALVEDRVRASMAMNYIGASNLALYLQKARSFLADFLLTSPHTACPLLIATLGLAVTFLKITGRLKREIFIVTVVALTAFDMGFMTVSHVPLVDLQKHPFSPAATSIDLIRSDTGLYRVVSFSAASDPPILPREIGSVYGIQSATGYENLTPLNIGSLLTFEVVSDLQRVRMTPIGTDLANVKYLITGPHTELPSPRFELLYNREVRLYRDRDVLPRAFLVSAYEVIPESKRAIARVRSSGFDSHTSAVLDRSPEVPLPNAQLAKAKIEVLDYQPTKVTIKVDTPVSGLLVLSDTYYPGWQGIVDGQSSPILRANGVMRALALEAGQHLVRFEYTPESLKVGMSLSAIALLLASAFIVVSWFAERKSESKVA